MATVRDARRALAQGHVDEALVDLWNALEPLRLHGDRRGLKAVASMASWIAAHGDGSQAREAGRLLEAVRETLDPDARLQEPVAVQVGAPAGTPFEPDGFEEVEDDVSASEPGPDVESDVEETARGGQRAGRLIWALIVAAFVIFNVVSGLLRE